MIITSSTLGALTPGTLYTITFTQLDRIPFFIKTGATANNITPVTKYTDATATTVLVATYNAVPTDPVWLVDLTQ